MKCPLCALSSRLHSRCLMDAVPEPLADALADLHQAGDQLAKVTFAHDFAAQLAGDAMDRLIKLVDEKAAAVNTVREHKDRIKELVDELYPTVPPEAP